MYIVDGIAYAGEPEMSLKVVGVKPLSDYRLWVRFNTGEARVYDCNPLFDYPCFAPLKDVELFREVYIDYGIPAWMNGEIDIAPEEIYEKGVAVDNVEIA